MVKQEQFFHRAFTGARATEHELLSALKECSNKVEKYEKKLEQAQKSSHNPASCDDKLLRARTELGLL
jgi:hypothetical protein